MMNSLDRIAKVIKKLVNKTCDRYHVTTYMAKKDFEIINLATVSPITDKYVFRRFNGEINEYVHVYFQAVSCNTIKVTGCTTNADDVGACGLNEVVEALRKQKGREMSADEIWNFMRSKRFVLEDVMVNGTLWKQIGTNNFILIQYTDDVDGVFTVNIKKVVAICEPNNQNIE